MEVFYRGREPYRATDTAAGFDLYADEDITIFPGETTLIRTGTYVEMPKNSEGLVHVRSSLGKQGVMLANGVGVIDSDYRGEICLLLYNGNVSEILKHLILGTDLRKMDNTLDLSIVPGVVRIKKGERIGQIRFRYIPDVRLKEKHELSETERGEGGFGSTGKE